MHPQTPLLTFGGTVLKESDNLVILGVAFHSKMTFLNHLRTISRVAGEYSMIDRFLGDAFRGFVLLILGFVLLGCRYTS